MENLYKRTANGGYEVTQNMHNFLSFSPDGTPEMAPSNIFVIRIIIFLVNLQFIFQGSQKSWVRVAISQKGLVQLFSNWPHLML